ncbi:beta-xylosidase [Mucilaginibacter oryzae]|uniref:Beta-xylosidase n=1 Tax=Mucilaginibacter oryzae TaxID=468058 RepID=A0A316HEE4_9SPHI|nr:glycoside hydrolase 43 family protein [Mucilaginibacter oryzae]PWK78866.1 beta-xylosidase [Mucilaginibacter oryzae]
MISFKYYLLVLFVYAALTMRTAAAQSWTADNGNGTYTNPLFYDEFSDPDLIRVGTDYYITGTTMHSVPGLPVLHSTDLVNWKLLSYALPRFDDSDDFNLRNGKEAYGQGIWAPCIRYHNGNFYIFSNINRHGLQVFTAKNPGGPWKRHDLAKPIYDLSALFEVDRIYIVYGQSEIRMIELKPDLSGFVPNSDRLLIPKSEAMGEGNHFYKINGKYYITNADGGRLQCARSANIYGPYETTVISAKETMGTSLGWFTNNMGQETPLPSASDSLTMTKLNGQVFGSVPMHQGGIVDTPDGGWWGFSMMDFRSVGRTTFLSPVTWADGWPYFGIPGNPGRSPKTWFKPNNTSTPHAPYLRSDDFKSGRLSNAWQWNHNPVYTHWKLKHGELQLYTLPAKDFLWARNTLTQRGVGPQSEATVTLDASQLEDGDIAGLGLMNIPYAWVAVLRQGKQYTLRFFDQYKHQTINIPLKSPRVSLRAFGDFDHDIAQLSFSTGATRFESIGDSIRLPYQLKTFQGTRFALFAYNTLDKEGGYAAFSKFELKEPMADRSKNLPIGKIITLTNLADQRMVWADPHGMLVPGDRYNADEKDAGYRFKVLDRGNGLVVLQALNGTGFVTISGRGMAADVRLAKQETTASLLMWQDMLRGECMLLSLHTNRFIGLNPNTGELYGADWAGTLPGKKDGTVFTWHEVTQ